MKKHLESQRYAGLLECYAEQGRGISFRPFKCVACPWYKLRMTKVLLSHKMTEAFFAETINR